MNATTYYTHIESPLGQLLLTGSESQLTGLYLPNHKGQVKFHTDWQSNAEPFAAVGQQLAEYFAGERQAFNLPLQLVGTPFQQRVWQQLAKIPFGTTITYAELARRIGQPTASRAVGNANGRNKISIVIPCHRVIGADGKLTGYAGGIENKRWLLDWEGGLTKEQRYLFVDSTEGVASDADSSADDSQCNRSSNMVASSGKS